MLLLLLHARSHETHKNYCNFIQHKEVVPNINMWNGPVTVWLQLQQSVNAVCDTKTFTPFAVHCVSKCVLRPVATLQLIFLFLAMK